MGPDLRGAAKQPRLAHGGVVLLLHRLQHPVEGPARWVPSHCVGDNLAARPGTDRRTPKRERENKNVTVRTIDPSYTQPLAFAAQHQTHMNQSETRRGGAGTLSWARVYIQEKGQRRRQAMSSNQHKRNNKGVNEPSASTSPPLTTRPTPVSETPAVVLHLARGAPEEAASR